MGSPRSGAEPPPVTQRKTYIISYALFHGFFINGKAITCQEKYGGRTHHYINQAFPDNRSKRVSVDPEADCIVNYKIPFQPGATRERVRHLTTTSFAVTEKHLNGIEKALAIPPHPVLAPIRGIPLLLTKEYIRSGTRSPPCGRSLYGRAGCDLSMQLPLQNVRALEGSPQ